MCGVPLVERGQGVGQAHQVPVGAGWGSGGGQQRGHVLHGTVGVAGDVVEQRLLVGGAAQVESRGRHARGRPAAARARRGPGRRSDGRAGRGSGSSRSPSRLTGSGSLTRGPSRRPRHTTRPTEARTSRTSPGPSQSGRSEVMLTPSSAPRSPALATYQTSRPLPPSSRSATAALSARRTWSLVSSCPAPSSVNRSPTTSERSKQLVVAPTSGSAEPSSTAIVSPSYRVVAAGGDVVGCVQARGETLDPEDVEQGRGRVDHDDPGAAGVAEESLDRARPEVVRGGHHHGVARHPRLRRSARRPSGPRRPTTPGSSSTRATAGRCRARGCPGRRRRTGSDCRW